MAEGAVFPLVTGLFDEEVVEVVVVVVVVVVEGDEEEEEEEEEDDEVVRRSFARASRSLNVWQVRSRAVVSSWIAGTDRRACERQLGSAGV